MSTGAKDRGTRLELAPQCRRQRLPRREQAAQRGAHVAQVRRQRDAGRRVARPAVHIRRAALAQQRRKRDRKQLSRMHRVCCALRSGACWVSGGTQKERQRFYLTRCWLTQVWRRHADQGVVAVGLTRARARSGVLPCSFQRLGRNQGVPLTSTCCSDPQAINHTTLRKAPGHAHM